MTQETTQVVENIEIEKDLQDQLGALRAIATAHNLLDKGVYSHSQLPAVSLSLEFLRSLHTSTVAQAVQHPQADLIPELVQFKAAQSEDNE